MAARKGKAAPATSIAAELVKEAVAHDGDWKDKIGVGGVAVSRSSIVASMRERLQHRKAITAAELVPGHVHEIYAQIWRGEDEARRSEERARAEYSWRGLWRRLLDRIVGKPRDGFHRAGTYQGSSGCHTKKLGDAGAESFLG